MYEWHWQIIGLYKTVFLQGAGATLALTLFTVVLGTAVGAALAFLKQSRNLLSALFAKVYIELFRALPILVVIIWMFYVVPILFDWRISAFLTAGIALSLHLSAFVAETVRAAIESVHKHQMESALALGMTRAQAMRRIILPQAVRNMVPNLLGLYINELKNSSLASIIAVNELLHRSNILISQTFRPLEIYTTVAVVYIVIILPFVYLARRYERHVSRGSQSVFAHEYDAGN